jgi:hypothetical protein
MFLCAMVPRFTRFTPPKARRTTEGVAAQGHETQQRWAWHHTQRVFGQVHGARRSVKAVAILWVKQ